MTQFEDRPVSIMHRLIKRAGSNKKGIDSLELHANSANSAKSAKTNLDLLP